MTDHFRATGVVRKSIDTLSAILAVLKAEPPYLSEEELHRLQMEVIREVNEQRRLLLDIEERGTVGHAYKEEPEDIKRAFQNVETLLQRKEEPPSFSTGVTNTVNTLRNNRIHIEELLTKGGD